jgi:tRNA threonylcarbamoyladenosine biosynthesis protein TsaE
MHALGLEFSNEKQCVLSAKKLAKCLFSPSIITFSGEIGAGKTTFIRAMLKGLGVSAAIKSPTFSIVESYTMSSFSIHHFDLYRIQDETELDYIGFRDYFENSGIVLIEWPERALGSISEIDLQCELLIKGDERVMNITSLTATGEQIMSCFIGKS